MQKLLQILSGRECKSLVTLNDKNDKIEKACAAGFFCLKVENGKLKIMVVGECLSKREKLSGGASPSPTEFVEILFVTVGAIHESPENVT